MTIRVLGRQVITLHLRYRITLSTLVLVADVMKQASADSGVGIQSQSQAVETNLVVVTVGASYSAVTDTLSQVVDVVTTLCARDTELLHHTYDDSLGLLAGRAWGALTGLRIHRRYSLCWGAA